MTLTTPVNADLALSPTGKTRRGNLKTFLLNAPVIIAKQHLFCCVLFPLLSAMIGGSLGAALHTERAEIIAGVIAVPLVTLAVMSAEQWWYQSKYHKHDHSDPHHHHDILTLKKYLLQLAIGYAVFFIAHAVLP